MKKILSLMFVFAISVPGMANACSISHASDLSDEQIQQLKVQCEQMKLEVQASKKAALEKELETPVVTKENIGEWAVIAQEFAKALGIAAREIGVSVNEFLKSPAGVLTAGILIFMTVGKSIMAFFVGMLFTYIVFKLNNRVWFDQYETIETTNIFGKTKQKRVARYNNWSQVKDDAVALSAGSIIVLGAYWGLMVYLVG